MDKLKEKIASVAPYVLCWIMGLISYYMAENTEKGFDALISIIEVFK